MPRLILFLFLVVFLVAGCNKISSRKDLDRIRELEKMVKDMQEEASRNFKPVDLTQLQQLADAYTQFVDNYPDASETPEFLFRAGELYSNELNDIPKAITLFEKDYQKYPEHETAPTALFFTGYLYNNSLHDLIKAEAAYQAFLEKYPTNSLVPSVKLELGILGMDDADAFRTLVEPEKIPEQHSDSVRLDP